MKFRSHGKKLSTLICLSAFSLSALSLDGAETCVNAEAQVLEYYEALRSGDVQALTNQLGGRLVEKREPLLTNPTYPQYLIETYGGRDVEIHSCEPRSDDAVRLRVTETVSGPSIEKIHKVFVLVMEDASRNYLIVSESLAFYD